jgi:glycosyltransferase involved in cell wall biosynthesis
MDTLMRSCPLVSVLIPVFNGERHLSQALDSIQKQTYTNLEIIIINDGSTDGSAAIIETFTQNDKRALAIHKQNTGLTDTLNHGLRLASGQWLARMDQDDVASPVKIEQQIDKVLDNSALVLVGTDFCTLAEETGHLRRYRLPVHHKQLVRRLRYVRGFFPHSSALFHVATARQVGGYDTRALYNEDWDLWLKLSEVGEISSLAENLVTIRKHQAQMTRNSGEVVPQGEAFVSSTLHFMRTDRSVNVTHLDLRDLQVRNQIKNTRKYKEFCEVVRFQENVRCILAAEKTYLAKILRGFFLLTRLQRSFELVRFSLFGTAAPKAVAAEVARALCLFEIEMKEETQS